MMVLGVVGSPRREGNTDVLVSEVLRGAQDAGSQVKKVFLNDLKITPCQSICSSYCKKMGECQIRDDMTTLYNMIFGSNVIILGTPVYWYGPSAQLKAFIDRWYSFSHPQFIHKVEGKSLVLVAAFEEKNLSVAEPLVTMMEKSANYLKMNFLEELLITADEQGAVKQNSDVLTKAYQIGLKLK